MEMDLLTCPVYAAKAMQNPAPDRELPKTPVSPQIAKQIIMDELSLDRRVRLNMATFVTSWMEPQADELMVEGMRKNLVDLDVYGQSAEFHKRCVNIVGNLLNAPDPGKGKDYVGVGTIGSSEAIMLALLAMKFKWRRKRESLGLPTDRPNLIFGANAHISWSKACLYFDIEPRKAPVSEDCLVLTAERVMELIDDRTVGIALMFASTINGEYEDVKSIHDAVQQANLEIPIHVDAASGGFVAPFITPDLLWDFRLPGVRSINTSGHKFGLVYAGIGWAIFRDTEDLPKELVFHI
jgi:glutamate decarboxylase